MSSRKVHWMTALFAWAGAFIIYYFVAGRYIEISLQKNAMWIMLSCLLTLLGGLMPDWDLIWEHGFPHRNLISHSIIAPALICIPMAFINEDTKVFLPLYSCFLLGYASHLFLDLIGTKKWMGSACIRFYWLKGERHRQMGKHLSRFTLLLNSFILFAASVISMFTYHLWI